ncbi:MAG: permease-like cell division protein FtsX [Lachnospiraceae bacterium]|nr:permease-like cell division protein FtsX [Lachnospiraceae bacterium]
MSFKAFSYSVKQGLLSIRRNRMFSLASIGTMMACLFMLGVFLSILINFNHIVSSAESTVTISVYFNSDVTPERIAEIGRDISARKEVASAKYKSADDAWAEFAKEYYADDEDLLASFGEDNPLGDSDSYVVTLKSIRDQETITKYLQAITGVRYVNSPQATMESLNKLNRIISVASISLIVILLLVSIFLISNTVVVAISVRREEIAIMRLIGATSQFIRGPFIVEGVVIGFTGAVIPLLLLFGLYQLLLHLVENDLATMASWLQLMSAGHIFAYLVPICLVLGIGIGLLGSLFTVRKHLQV